MSNQISDLNGNQNQISFHKAGITSFGGSPVQSKVKTSQSFALTQNYKQHAIPTTFNKAQHTVNALSNSLVTLDWVNPSELPQCKYQQQSHSFAIQNHPQRVSNPKVISSPVKSVKLKGSPMKPSKEYQAKVELPEQTQQQIQVQMEMQIRKQQLKLQMEQNHLEQMKQLSQQTATAAYRQSLNMQQEPQLVPVAIVLEAPNPLYENKLRKSDCKTPAGTSFQN